MTLATKDLYDDARNFVRLSSEELFALDSREVEKIQLHHFKQRFDQLRGSLSALERLSDDIGITSITSLDDLASLAFPHTMYKSYSVADVENNRYDRLTRFLQSLTTHDLSRVDVNGCTSLDDWMDRLEANTPLRPTLSSGTSGKISIFPRSTVEEPFWYEHVLRIFDDPYRREETIPMRGGKIPFISPWTCDKGRHNVPIIFRLLRDNLYAGDAGMILTLGTGVMSAEELWLSGKLRRAEALGEKPNLSDGERRLEAQIDEKARGMEKRWDSFVERAIVEQRGKQVIVLAPWAIAYQMAKVCVDRGVKIEWAPDSVMLVGGGTKGYSFPDNWMDVVNAAYPFKYPHRMFEAYSMTETTAVATRCANGFLHPLPWGIQHLVDPETGVPLPRQGTQKGRLLVFDLLASTYWAGTATGDEVIVHWDRPCGCGRNGHFFENSVTRLSEKRGGDDKITCAKTPQAYARLEEYLIG